MRTSFMGILADSTLVASCGADTSGDGVQPTGDLIDEASLIDGTGGVVGSVNITEDANGTTLEIEVSGLDEGLHGVHLHETGKCDPSEFSSAGGHWNPTGAQHGRDNPKGSHLGDLANIGVSESGEGKATYLLASVLRTGTQTQISDDDGTALVIHAGPDDYRSDPSGESGSRLACAVLAEPR